MNATKSGLHCKQQFLKIIFKYVWWDIQIKKLGKYMNFFNKSMKLSTGIPRYW